MTDIIFYIKTHLHKGKNEKKGSYILVDVPWPIYYFGRKSTTKNMIDHGPK